MNAAIIPIMIWNISFLSSSVARSARNTLLTSSISRPKTIISLNYCKLKEESSLIFGIPFKRKIFSTWKTYFYLNFLPDPLSSPPGFRRLEGENKVTCSSAWLVDSSKQIKYFTCLSFLSWAFLILFQTPTQVGKICSSQHRLGWSMWHLSQSMIQETRVWFQEKSKFCFFKISSPLMFLCVLGKYTHFFWRINNHSG